MANKKYLRCYLINMLYFIMFLIISSFCSGHLYCAEHIPVTYYVSPEGNDANDGLSENKPFKELPDAIYRMQLGDTLIVLPGDYTVTDFVAWCKDPYRDMMYLGKEGGSSTIRTTIKGKKDAPRPRIIVESSNGSPRFVFNGAKGVTFEHLEIVHGEIGYGDYLIYKDCIMGGHGTAYAIHGGHNHVLIENNYIHDIHGGSDAIGVYITGDDNIIRNNFFKNMGHHAINSNTHGYGDNKSPSERWLIEGNIITQTSGHGIGLQNTQDFIIRNNLLVNVGSQAISFGGNVFPDKNIKVIGNTIYNGNFGMYGFLFINDVEGVIIENNILVHKMPVAFLKPDIQLSKVKMQTYSFRNNLYYNPYRDEQRIFFPTNDPNHYFDVEGWQQYSAGIMGDGKGLERGSLNIDPQVVSPPNSATDYLEYDGSSHINMALNQNSPAIDTGIENELLTVDINGNSRPMGNGYDIGAYEGNGETPPPVAETPPGAPKSLKIVN